MNYTEDLHLFDNIFTLINAKIKDFLEAQTGRKKANDLENIFSDQILPVIFLPLLNNPIIPSFQAIKSRNWTDIIALEFKAEIKKKVEKHLIFLTSIFPHYRGSVSSGSRKTFFLLSEKLKELLIKAELNCPEMINDRLTPLELRNVE